MTPAQTRDALVAEMRKAAQVESERSWEGARHGADEFILEQWADRLAALPVGDAEPVAALTFDAWRAANVARCLKWHPAGINSWSPSDWLVAVTGELGELASLLKMRNRERDGLPGNKFSPTDKQVADEIADVFAYLDLLAAALGVDLAQAAVNKFNEVSERVGFPDRIVVTAPPALPDKPVSKMRVSIHGLFDMHLFYKYTGATVDEVIQSWTEHVSKPIPGNVDGRDIGDMGPTSLCPAIVLDGDKELRRVGEMVFVDYKSRRPHATQLAKYRAALLADPDIPRLLAARPDAPAGEKGT